MIIAGAFPLKRSGGIFIAGATELEPVSDVGQTRVGRRANPCGTLGKPVWDGEGERRSGLEARTGLCEETHQRRRTLRQQNSSIGLVKRNGTVA